MLLSTNIKVFGGIMAMPTFLPYVSFSHLLQHDFILSYFLWVTQLWSLLGESPRHHNRVFQDGLKYLGFMFKPNEYGVLDMDLQ